MHQIWKLLDRQHGKLAIRHPITNDNHHIPISMWLPSKCSACRYFDWKQSDIPFALTQLALRLGSADWSLMCSIDSVGSWYIKLLERRLLPFLPSLITAFPDENFGGVKFVLAAKDKVRGRSRGDRLAVLDKWGRGRKMKRQASVRSNWWYVSRILLVVKAAESERWRSVTRLWMMSISLSPGIEFKYLLTT